MVIRYLRVRLGDEQRTQDDAIATYRKGHDVILDHCSASWSVDETLSATNANKVTVQWCFITESLNRSRTHKGKHGYGSLINGDEISYHHNLYAHHTTRVPRPAECPLDFRNNVMYDFGRGYNHNEKTRMNYVGNYIQSKGERRLLLPGGRPQLAHFLRRQPARRQPCGDPEQWPAVPAGEDDPR